MDHISKLTRSQQRIANLAKAALDDLWRKYSTLPPQQFQDLLLELLPALVDDYGKAAGSAAAQWYEETRATVLNDEFRSRTQTANLDAVRGSVRWAGGDIFEKQRDLELAHNKMSAIVQRHVRGAGRDTVLDSVKRDPAKPRWARRMQGRETCGWCRMLASRGFIYKTEDTAGASHAWGHDRCDCEAVPDFSFTEEQFTAQIVETEYLYNQYLDVRSRIDSLAPTDSEIVAEWDRSMVNYREIRKQLAKERSGATLDGTLQQRDWDKRRREVLERLELEFPDGYVGTRRLPPRNPAQAPPDWPADLPILRAKEWNHALYGESRAGGHLHGYGWINDRPEFDPVHAQEWLANAAAKVTRDSLPIQGSGRLEGIVDGVTVYVSVAVRRGVARVTSIFPKT